MQAIGKGISIIAMWAGGCYFLDVLVRLTSNKMATISISFFLLIIFIVATVIIATSINTTTINVDQKNN